MTDTDLDLLAYDISDMLSRNEYPIDVGIDAIRAALPSFIDQAVANQELLDNGALPAPTLVAPHDPTPQTGQPPRMTHMAWFRDRGLDIGATAADEWYWGCPHAGCHVWAGPYQNPDTAARNSGMRHLRDQHRDEAGQR